MPRKKSAAKKARELEQQNKLKSEKKVLEFDADDKNNNEDDNNLHINKEYAKRFEHNKEREEIQRLEEKLKGKKVDFNIKKSHSIHSDGEDVDDEDDEDDEDEDEDAELITKEVDLKINSVLEALKKNDKVLYDNSFRFFDDKNDKDSLENKEKNKKEKPIYLKDYHRMNILSKMNDDNNEGDDDNENNELPYEAQQAYEKNKLVAEIHSALDSDKNENSKKGKESKNNDNEDDNDDDDDDDDDFLVESKTSREIVPINLPDPDKDSEKFLEAYVNSEAWKDTNGYNNINTFETLEEDEEFLEKAERIESKYNFRFEEPGATEITSYSRNIDSVRRENTSSRKKAREAEKEKKLAEKEKEKKEIERLKRLKTKNLLSKIEQVKEVIGDSHVEIPLELLEGDFEADDWDKRAAELFNKEFYEKEDKKPEWDDDIEIDSLDGNEDEDKEKDEKKIKEKKSEKIIKDSELKEDKIEKEKDQEQEEEQESKRGRKRKVEELKKKIETAVEAAYEPEVDGKKGKSKFRYREVSPDSYGLTPRDILLADDNQLNTYLGLRKLAPFRPEDKKHKDKKRFAKKKRLREWRKAVFGYENPPEEEDLLKKYGANTPNTARYSDKKPEEENKKDLQVNTTQTTDGKPKHKKRRKH